MTRDELIAWLLANGYAPAQRFLAPGNEPGWAVFANHERGRVVAVCDDEVVIGSGLLYAQAALTHCHVSPDRPDWLGIEGGDAHPLIYRFRRRLVDVETLPLGTLSLTNTFRACARDDAREALDRPLSAGSIATAETWAHDGGPR